MRFFILIFILYQISDTVHGAGRIYGGYRIKITKAPYAVHSQYDLGDGWVSECGGSILSKNLILTAAHCTMDKNTGKQHEASRYTIRVGSTYKESGGKTHKVVKVFTHPKYIGKSDHFHHDVGILQLKDEITFGNTARLTELAHPDDKICIGADTLVNGWGTNPDHPRDERHLYQVHLYTINATECAEGFTDTSREIGEHEICVQGDEKSTCAGDSGGALIYTKTGRQIGIVSYGTKDCTIGYPSVFTKVQDNFDFINKVKEETGNKSGDETEPC